MRAARWAAATAFALALAACMTPPRYGPLGVDHARYGYRDHANGDGGYTIFVQAPTEPMAREFWDQRAAELCGGTNFHRNIFRAERPIVQQSGYASNGYGGGGSYTVDAYGAVHLEGYLRCEGDDNAAATETADAGAEDGAPAAPDADIVQTTSNTP